MVVDAKACAVAAATGFSMPNSTAAELPSVELDVRGSHVALIRRSRAR